MNETLWDFKWLLKRVKPIPSWIIKQDYKRRNQERSQVQIIN
jgi:hypothetical protein